MIDRELIIIANAVLLHNTSNDVHAIVTVYGILSFVHRGRLTLMSIFLGNTG